jgi:PilZ domain
MAERRRFSRIKRRYLVDFDAGERIGSGFTGDISATGIFVCAVYLPRPGTSLRLCLKVPGGKRILLRGCVVRSYKVPARLARFVPGGFCVRLKNAPEEYFQLLATLFRIAA